MGSLRHYIPGIRGHFLVGRRFVVVAEEVGSTGKYSGMPGMNIEYFPRFQAPSASLLVDRVAG